MGASRWPIRRAALRPDRQTQTPRSRSGSSSGRAEIEAGEIRNEGPCPLPPRRSSRTEQAQKAASRRLYRKLSAHGPSNLVEEQIVNTLRRFWLLIGVAS